MVMERKRLDCARLGLACACRFLAEGKVYLRPLGSSPLLLPWSVGRIAVVRVDACHSSWLESNHPSQIKKDGCPTVTRNKGWHGGEDGDTVVEFLTVSAFAFASC